MELFYSIEYFSYWVCWLVGRLLVLLWVLGVFLYVSHLLFQSPLKCIFWLRYAVRKDKTVDSVQ